MPNANCLSYWFPKIQAAGLPVPKTTIIRTDCRLDELVDGPIPTGFGEFIQLIQAAGDAMGWPIFLRTGHASGKHQWQSTCYVPVHGEVGQHLFNLVEHSETVDIIGLPTNVWAVREFLKVKHSFHAFRGMPVGREFRAFVVGGAVQCIHPYWPPESICDPDDEEWADKLLRLSRLPLDERHTIQNLAQRAAEAVEGGDWSVDCLQTATGEWLVIDMAAAERSFHWPECVFSSDG